LSSNIYQKILAFYPFLTKREKDSFKRKAAPIIRNGASNNLELKEIIEKLLRLLNNPHADIKRYKKSTKKEAERKHSPSFNIEKKIIFIKISSWTMWLGDFSKKLVNVCVKNLNKYDGIIIDVRENYGGSSSTAFNFARIFFDKSVIYGRFIKRISDKGLKTSIGRLSPDKKNFINKPIVILVSKKCFSSTELFLSLFKISKRAVIIGEKTRGGSGCPISEIIKINKVKYIVRIPTWRFFLKGKNKPIEKTKINPDLTYKKSDIEEFAKKYLLEHHKND
jgi:C-terminal processing protease CtpA/Prc